MLRRRFSASNFLREVREQRCNTFVYVGELCRYLMNQPPAPDDADNPLEKMIGNGLRPDIWKPFKTRFGVPRVHEIYGASEGNSGFVNAFNKDETIGFGVTPHVLVKYDDEDNEIVRDPHGMCIPVPRGQPGLLLNKIDAKAPFDGYTDRDASATGRLVPEGDPEALAACIEELLSDAEQRARLAAAGQARVAQAFDADRGAALLGEAFERVQAARALTG